MKVPRSPLPGKSLEQAWKASEAEGVRACGERRAGERAAPGSEARRGRRRRAFWLMARPPPAVGSQEPAGQGKSGLALGVNGVVRQHSRGEGVDAQSKLYKSTVLQHLGF